jgi:hypothetical protein
LTPQNQVGQVVKVIASWHKLPLLVAEESVCSKLKTKHLAGSLDMEVRGQDLYSCQLNKHRQAEIWALLGHHHVQRKPSPERWILVWQKFALPTCMVLRKGLVLRLLTANAIHQ